jgi:hypothetical protein
MNPRAERLFGANVFPEPVSVTNSKVLRAWNEFWVAGAVWEKRDGHWFCVHTAPIIAWMRKMTPESAKLELARRGCQWEWI